MTLFLYVLYYGFIFIVCLKAIKETNPFVSLFVICLFAEIFLEKWGIIL